MSQPMFRGDGFVIENNIIKSTEKSFCSDDDRSIGKIIFDTLSSSPNHIGQIEAKSGAKCTFENMKNQSVSLAIWLQKQGIKTGDVVANCLPIHPDVYSMIFSTMFIGATYCSWDIEMNLELASYYLDLIQPKILFACENKLDMLQEAARLGNHSVKIIVLDDQTHGVYSFKNILNMQTSEEIKNFTVLDVDPQSVCLIAFSSGTTGLPKASLHSYEKMYKCAIIIGLKEDAKNLNEIALMYFYPSWCVHYLCLLSFVVNKATQIIHDDIYNVHEICKIIEKYQVTYLFLHTHTLVSICKACVDQKYNLESIKKIVPVGFKLHLKAFKAVHKTIPKAFVEIQYGMTEADIMARHTKNCKNLASAGTIVPGAQLKIIDRQTAKTLGPNEKGEVCVKTSTMMMGYYKNPDGALVFDDEGWLHTGDEAYYNEIGEVTIVGRFKDVINYKFYHVPPSCVEQLLRTHPNIVEAAVVPIPHEIDGERAVAFIKTEPNSKVTKEVINQLVLELEIPDLLDDRIYFIEKMPYNNNGKLKKSVLIEMAKKFQDQI